MNAHNRAPALHESPARNALDHELVRDNFPLAQAVIDGMQNASREDESVGFSCSRVQPHPKVYTPDCAQQHTSTCFQQVGSRLAVTAHRSNQCDPLSFFHPRNDSRYIRVTR
jgi:hypothetical protein